MEELKHNKQNALSKQIYDRLLQNQAELTEYLKYIRHRPQPNKIALAFPKHLITHNKEPPKERKTSNLVKAYVQEYLKLVREVANLENYAGRKIITKLLQYLEEFPTMVFLVETINSFGRERKKLCLNESLIQGEANDEMIPLFQKIIERVQLLKKEAESKKLMELGQRIAHLNKMVDGMKKPPIVADSPLRQLQQERVEKYFIMQENISKAQKNYGKFSQQFHKNQQIFSNINKVYDQISKAQQSSKN